MASAFQFVWDDGDGIRETKKKRGSAPAKESLPHDMSAAPGKGRHPSMSMESIDAVLACSQSKNSARLVLFVIAHHQNRDGFAYLSIPTIMRETNLSERSVQQGIRTLQKLHELAVEYGKGPRGCNVYRILIQPDPRKVCGGRKSSGAKFSEKGGQTLPPNLILKLSISDSTHSNGNGAHVPEGSMISPEVRRKFGLRYGIEDWPPPRRERG